MRLLAGLLLPALVFDYLIPIANRFNVLSASKDGFVRRIGRTTAENHGMDFEDFHASILWSAVREIDWS